MLCSEKNISTLAFDNDHDCIESFYKKLWEEKKSNIIPLVIDINNPSPGIGWNNKERMPLFERQKPGLIIFLALVHHISVGNNVSFEVLSKMLGGLSGWLIIEFVGKEDEMFKRITLNREFDLDAYNIEKFEEAFAKHYKIVEKASLKNGLRTIYLMKNHEG